jgi:hypothetical protein
MDLELTTPDIGTLRDDASRVPFVADEGGPAEPLHESGRNDNRRVLQLKQLHTMMLPEAYRDINYTDSSEYEDDSDYEQDDEGDEGDDEHPKRRVVLAAINDESNIGDDDLDYDRVRRNQILNGPQDDDNNAPAPANNNNYAAEYINRDKRLERKEEEESEERENKERERVEEGEERKKKAAEEEERKKKAAEDDNYDVIDTNSATFTDTQRETLVTNIMAKVNAKEMCDPDTLGSWYVAKSLREDRYILAVRDHGEYIGFATLQDMNINGVDGMYLSIVCSKPGKGENMMNRVVTFARTKKTNFLSLESTLSAMKVYLNLKMRFPRGSDTKFVIGKGCDVRTEELQNLHDEVVALTQLWNKLDAVTGVAQLPPDEKKAMNALLKRIVASNMRSNPSGVGGRHTEADSVWMTLCFWDDDDDARPEPEPYKAPGRSRRR